MGIPLCGQPFVCACMYCICMSINMCGMEANKEIQPYNLNKNAYANE